MLVTTAVIIEGGGIVPARRRPFAASVKLILAAVTRACADTELQLPSGAITADRATDHATVKPEPRLGLAERLLLQ